MPADAPDDLRRGTLLQLSVCADASGPSRDGRDRCTGSSRPIRSTRACWRSAAAPAATCWRWRRPLLASRPSAWISPRPPSTKRSGGRARSGSTNAEFRRRGRPRTDERTARAIRLRDRPRRLRLDAGGRPTRRCCRRSRPRSPRAGSRTSPSTRSPAGTSGACCATSGSGTPATRTGAEAQGHQGPGALPVPQGAAGERRRHVRRAARSARCRSSPTPRATGSCTTTCASTGRPAGSRSSPSTRPRHGLGYVGEADLFSLRSEMLPEGVEPHVWNLADGDRIAFENLSDLLIARHFRQSVVCHAGGREATRRARPRTGPAAALGVRPNAEPLEVGLTADAFARARSAPPARAARSPSCSERSAPNRRRWRRRCSTASGASG